MRSRSFAGFAITAGAVWFLSPFIPAVLPGVVGRYYEVLVIAAPLVFVLGLVGFYRAYAEVYGRAGRIGIVLLGIGVLGFVPLATHQRIALYTLPVGVVLVMVAHGGAITATGGTVAMGIDAWRTGVPSKAMAVWLPLALPVTALTNYVGMFVLDLYTVGFDYYAGLFGLAWIGLGIELWRSE